MYRDDQGRTIIVAQGIGGPDGDWGVFRVKASGAMQRLKQLPMDACRQCVETKLHAYAATRKGWEPCEEGGEA